MPPTFKNPLRSLISSVFPMSVLTALGSDAGSKAVPVTNVAMAIVVWVQLIMALLRPWSAESRAVWAELAEYRIHRAYICKNDNGNEHEYVVVDLFRIEHKQHHLFLRLERSAGERKDSPSSSPSSSSIGTYHTSGSEDKSPSSPSPASSPDFYTQRSSGSSISISSVKEGITKMAGSLRRAARRLSDSSLSRPSGISSNKYMAADTVKRIEKFQAPGKVVRTIEFRSTDRSKLPSLWDLMILAYVIHEDSTTYELFEKQCFWFADTVSAVLEKWSESSPTDVAIIKGGGGPVIKSRFLKRNKSSGSVGIFVVHRRDPAAIDQVWRKFRKQKEEMDAERLEYENARAEELRKAEELARQVRELKVQQDQREKQLRKEQDEKVRRLRKEQDEKEQRLRKEQEERDQRHQEEQHRLRREQDEKERRLRKEQDEKERQLRREQEERDQRHQEEQHRLRKEQDEKERQLKREQEERDQRHQEEQRLLKQQFQRQLQHQLQENNREWETRLQQKDRETDRRLQELEYLIKMVNGGQTQLHAPAWPAQPQSRP